MRGWPRFDTRVTVLLALLLAQWGCTSSLSQQTAGIGPASDPTGGNERGVIDLEQNARPELVRTRFAMGTLVRIVVAGESTPELETAVAGAFDAMDDVVAHMSEWIPSSDIGRVNAEAGLSAVNVDPSVVFVLEQAQRVSERSNGAFDVTWAAMRGLWQYDLEAPRVPARENIEAILPLVDFSAIEIDATASTVRLPKEGMAIGLGGVAKGYAVAQAAQHLRDAGIMSFLIDAGGDLYAEGPRDGEGWLVGITHPRATGEVVVAVRLQRQALVTSGDYQRYFEVDGIRYHHIIDVRTGFPARGWASVSVICDDPTLADALSTAAFVLGKEGGVELIEAWEGAEGLFIDEDLVAVWTSGWPAEPTHPSLRRPAH